MPSLDSVKRFDPYFLALLRIFTALSFIPILCWALSGDALVGLAVNWARQRVAAAAAT